MSKCLKEFDSWNSKQKRIVPSNTGRFHTLVDSERKCAWVAALRWMKRELHVARDGFEPDLGLHSLLKRELGEKYNRKT